MEEDDLMSNNRLRRLNLNAPILSTRRVGSSPSFKSTNAEQHGASQRVPFSWEQVPGTPKGTVNKNRSTGEFMPPKLPPCQWHSTKRIQHDTKYDGDDDDDNFSDAVDTFSLSESLDIAQKKSNPRGLSSHDLKIMQSRETQSPDFIIRRFLPDATALATSYAPARPNHHSRELVDSQFPPGYHCSRESTDSQCQLQYSSQSPKACGIGLLSFPRRIKQQVCGLKHPILNQRGSQSVKVEYKGRQAQGASVEVFCKRGGRVHHK